MPTKYLVLRADKPIGGPAAWSTLSNDRANLSIQTYDGHEYDGADLRSDPRNAAVLDADVILQLIKATESPGNGDDKLRKVGNRRMPQGLLAVGAHTTPYTGQGVTVAVLDTGADTSHPAIASRHLAKKNFTSEGAGDDVTDSNGHGTHCAGTVCGSLVDDVQVGVAPGVAKLCVGKVLGNGGGTLETLLKGLFWAVVEERANVVSMSLGYDLPGNIARLIARGVDPALAAQAAMRQQADIIKGIGTLRTFLESQSPNVVIVAATGNESSRPKFIMDAGLPASELLAVGAVGFDGSKWDVASFSNGRAQVVGPGVDVLSAKTGGGWTSMSGTSMATPHVAGVAALWVERSRARHELSVPEIVRSAIRSTATRTDLAPSDADATGAGMVQAPQS